MAILYDPKERLFTLHTKNSTWQMKVSGYGHLLHVYYGEKVEDADLSYLLRGINRGFSGTPYEAEETGDRGYSLDTWPQEYPAFGTGDYRRSCVLAEHEDGSQAAEFLYVSHRICPGKYSLPGLPALRAGKEEAQTLEIRLKDRCTGLEVLLYYGVLEQEDVITRACILENTGSAPVILHRAMSCCVDFLRGDLDLITFPGRHAMERKLQRDKTRPGVCSVGSTRGTSSHQENPFVILCEKEAGEYQGACWGAAFVYSGNFLAETEVDQIGQTRLVMGIHPEGFRWRLDAGGRFAAPEVVLSYSGEGFSRLSHHFHDAYREHLLPPSFRQRKTPVLLNSWEAVEFTFQEETLLAMAESARELGIGLFVVDDGWFGSRDHDRSGLGDWFSNREKLPDGIEGLAEKIHGMGMQFGLWVEPEMVNEDSCLFREHPDWCLRIPGRAPNLERCQLVLDMGRREVRDYLFSAISQVLSDTRADYVKWDMNRNLSDVWSAALPASRQGEASHRYVLGLYELMDRLVRRFPDILWEGCSGGGGRFDAGILYYMPQIWCSDNTDAADRIRIQYGTSFGYPVCAMGAHVSSCPNGQTGRTVPLPARAETAMAGTFGYELDMRTFTEAERAQVPRQIADYERLSPLIREGDYYRLTDGEENRELAAWEFVSKDGRDAFVSVVFLHAAANPPFREIRLRGLDPKGLYRIEGEERLYRGNALMYAGLPLPVKLGDYQTVRYVLHRAEGEGEAGSAG